MEKMSDVASARNRGSRGTWEQSGAVLSATGRVSMCAMRHDRSLAGTSAGLSHRRAHNQSACLSLFAHHTFVLGKKIALLTRTSSRIANLIASIESWTSVLN